MPPPVAWYCPSIRQADPAKEATCGGGVTTAVGTSAKALRWVPYLTIFGRRVECHLSVTFARIVLIVLGWLALWSILPPEMMERTGNVFDPLLAVLASSLVGGAACHFFRLPALVGILLAAIAWGNISAGFFTEGITPDLRFISSRLGLTVIVSRAGFAVNFTEIKKMWKNVLALSLLPMVAEAVVHALVAWGLGDHPSIIWCFVQGFVVSGIAPGVVVPPLLGLREEGFGHTGPTSLMLSSVVLDSVGSIWLTSFFIDIIFSDLSLGLAIALGPIQLVGGCIVGAALAVLLHYATTVFVSEVAPQEKDERGNRILVYAQGHLDHVHYKTLVCYSTMAVSMVFLGERYNLAGGGAIGVLSMSAVIAHLWQPPPPRAPAPAPATALRSVAPRVAFREEPSPTTVAFQEREEEKAEKDQVLEKGEKHGSPVSSDDSNPFSHPRENGNGAERDQGPPTLVIPINSQEGTTARSSILSPTDVDAVVMVDFETRAENVESASNAQRLVSPTNSNKNSENGEAVEPPSGEEEAPKRPTRKPIGRRRNNTFIASRDEQAVREGWAVEQMEVSLRSPLSDDPDEATRTEEEIVLLMMSDCEDAFFPAQRQRLFAEYAFIWDNLVMPALFTGAGSNVRLYETFEPDFFPVAIATVVIGVVVRMIFAIIAALGQGFNIRELTFVALGWIGKAAVQAALGGTALTRARAENPQDPAKLRAGEQVQRIAMLSAIFMAPLSACAVVLLGRRWLPKE